jgi:hypothetical protein
MKAFVLGILAACGIAVGAYYALESLGWSSAERYRSGAVRL